MLYLRHSQNSFHSVLELLRERPRSATNEIHNPEYFFPSANLLHPHPPQPLRLPSTTSPSERAAPGRLATTYAWYRYPCECAIAEGVVLPFLSLAKEQLTPRLRKLYVTLYYFISTDPPTTLSSYSSTPTPRLSFLRPILPLQSIGHALTCSHTIKHRIARNRYMYVRLMLS